MTKEEFIEKARKVHGDKYDYSKVDYVNAKTKVCIICPIHGEFWQTPDNHLQGKKCYKCANKNMTTEDFILKARKVHGDKYDYSKVDYVNTKTKVCIICPKHGEFWQMPNSHLCGSGCILCSYDKLHEIKSFNKEEFIEKAKCIHGDKYDYSKVDYVNAKHKVCIICPTHGEFWQEAHLHTIGSQCPVCAEHSSKEETNLGNYIKELVGEDNVIFRDRKILNGYEIDILIPEKKIGIEYNGLFWHTEENGKDKQYHLNKTVEAAKHGIHLIHIFEDEWIEHKDIIKSKIKHILGLDDNKIKAGGRMCVVKEICKQDANSFLEKNHIQGFAPSSVYLGGYFQGALVGVMTFLKEENNNWNLNRFATDEKYSLPGLASKLFQYFLKTHKDAVDIKSFLDRRWIYSENNLYVKLGFELDNVLAPDYRYVVGLTRKHKFNFRKQKLSKTYNLPITMTESEMTKKLGFYKIWDCGLYRYVYHNKSE